MNALGWVFMLMSLIFVVGLVVWSFYKVMTTDGSRE